MEILLAALPYLQIALSILLIAGIVLQQTGSGLGGAFGGDNFSSGFNTRRGFEKFLFRSTIIIAILFALTAIVSLIAS
jgi:protein translocase SecG subunit